LTVSLPVAPLLLSRWSTFDSTLIMIKRKFGDAVRSKNRTSMINEVLCKLICHNLCCLNHEQCELGIETVFWGENKTISQSKPMSYGREPVIQELDEILIGFHTPRMTPQQFFGDFDD
jgi:hypothetical protein